MHRHRPGAAAPRPCRRRHLELLDAAGRLARWRFTLGQNRTRCAWSTQFEHSATAAPATGGAPSGRCPSCKAPLEADQDECPICTEVHTPPSTWTLFRLWRFAQPVPQGQLVAGFLLTLAVDRRHADPPYLTMPLMDDVLIPYQNGKPIDAEPGGAVPAGLLAAAVLALGAGLGADLRAGLVSERIGADLRTSTYDHLLRLSLEFFGGKRTGDLMSRIGTRHRPHLQLPVAQPARLRHRRADDRHDRR